jgi:hypothetical protein
MLERFSLWMETRLILFSHINFFHPNIIFHGLLDVEKIFFKESG